jgi:hypothetical protein
MVEILRAIAIALSVAVGGAGLATHVTLARMFHDKANFVTSESGERLLRLGWVEGLSLGTLVICGSLLLLVLLALGVCGLSRESAPTS